LAHSTRPESYAHAVTVAMELPPQPSWEALITLMARCGLRKNEVLQLRWNSVSLTSRTIIFEGWKNKSPRVIRLAGQAHAILLRLPKNSERVFDLEDKHLRAKWRRVCHRAGLQDLPMGAVRCSGIIQD
jgi:integrase